MKIDREIKETMDIRYKISGDKEAIMLAEMGEKAIIYNGKFMQLNKEYLNIK